jgi:hypothetical protein
VAVTTPDLRDFVPHAEVFPFSSRPRRRLPSAEDARRPTRPIQDRSIATNHPGIEGSRRDPRRRRHGFAAARIRDRLSYVHLQDVPPERVPWPSSATPNLSIGKMKMGHYGETPRSRA